jgi:DNA-binding NarL/FixJ family response regulator
MRVGQPACQYRVVRPSVLIVDDHRRFRASARALLESEGFDVVGEAADGDGALRETATLRPGLVLLDIQLPGSDGFAIAEQLASVPSAPAVILISSRDADIYGDRVRLAPVLGFVAKSELSGDAIERLLVSRRP